jgi:hypothetical protein
MTDEERECIIAESRETLDRTARLLAEAEDRDPVAEDAVERWRRLRLRSQGSPPMRKSAPDDLVYKRHEELAPVPTPAADDEEPLELSPLLMDAVGEALGEVRKQLRDEMAADVDRHKLVAEKLTAEVNEMRALIAALRAEVRVFIDTGQPPAIDLPQWRTGNRTN